METYNKEIIDITYLSELILDIFLLISYSKECQGFNSPR
jgi:hypothetical protein